MRDDRMKVALQLDLGADPDAQELDDLTAQLQDRLLELDVDSVAPAPASEMPTGAKAVDGMVLGSLIVTLATSPELLKAVIGTIQAWLGGHQGRSVELQVGGETLKVSGLSSEEQRHLIDLFVVRHAP